MLTRRSSSWPAEDQAALDQAPTSSSTRRQAGRPASDEDGAGWAGALAAGFSSGAMAGAAASGTSSDAWLIRSLSLFNWLVRAVTSTTDAARRLARSPVIVCCSDARLGRLARANRASRGRAECGERGWKYVKI